MIEEQELTQLCQQLHLPTIKKQLSFSLERAQRQQPGYAAFLLEQFQLEWENKVQKRAARRLKEAKFPTIKTLDGFDFSKAPNLPETLIRELALGEYIEKAQPIIFLGEPGTGKTHLASALGYAAAQQGHMVRFIAASQLVNLLVEAKDSRCLSAITQRFSRYKLLIIDELGYLPLSKSDSELLFQVISQRQECLPTIFTTNLPFGEWTSIFPDHRLCKALIDRITHHAHIIDFGEQSMRLEQTLTQLKGSQQGKPHFS